MANNQQWQTYGTYQQVGYLDQQQNQNTGALCPPPPYFNQYPTWGQQVSQLQSPTKRPRLDYYCKACDVALDSQAAFKAHNDSHIKCSQCEYVASPKLVKAHNQSAHGKYAGSGFKTLTIAIPGCPVQRFRICVGNDPEDVRKWIAERRKKFPRRQKTTAETSPSTAFNSLLDGYGSSSSENDDGGNEKKADAKQRNDGLPKNDIVSRSSTDKEHFSTDNKPRTRVCRFFARNGKCRNGDSCNFLHESVNMGSVNASRSNQKLLSRRRLTSKSSTLLQKLLRTDAQRESYLTIQLLKYIVNCNFLQEQRPLKTEKIDGPS